MTPEEIAKKTLTLEKKAFGVQHKPGDELWSIVYRAGYNENPRPSATEGGYGSKTEANFMLSTQQYFVATLVKEVIDDCIKAIEGTDEPTEVKQKLISTIRDQFGLQTN
jgi:hypothetical protein